MSEVLLTVAEVAARLKCHPHTVRRWIWASKLGAVKVGDMVRIPEEEVARMLRPQGVGSGAPCVPPQKGGKALVDLMAHLRTQLVPADVREMERLMAEGEQAAEWDSPIA